MRDINGEMDDAWGQFIDSRIYQMGRNEIGHARYYFKVGWQAAAGVRESVDQLQWTITTQAAEIARLKGEAGK